MFRYILPIILIGIAIAGFFTFTNPFYENVLLEREQVASYNEALNNSKALEAERDKLTQKYNSFDPENLSKLQKLLPDNVDNIRLILEIEKIASPYGMVLKDVRYDATNKDTAISRTMTTTQVVKDSLGKDYGVWNLEFSTQGTYNNFINFMKDLENNLRVADISSIQFSSNASMGLSSSLSEAYRYSFKIKTYWLKN
ncbi:MAG: hypothetical protein AAB913_02770 [Patescibacteria group bacterium]